MNKLENINTLTALDVFAPGKTDLLITQIEKEVRSFIPDTSTPAKRKDIASLAFKVSQSKTLLDKLGKSLVTDWKAKAGLVDKERRQVRERLDALRDEARQPLTEWENAEKIKIETEKLAKQISDDYDQAIIEDDLYNRQKEIERKEAVQAAEEAKRIAIEQAEKAEREKKAYEKRIAEEAEATAKIEAEAKAAKEKAKAEQLIIEAKAALLLEKEKAEREKLEAIEKAELDKQKAINEAIEKERETKAKQIAEAERVREIEAKKADNRRHQASINNKILKDLSSHGISEKIAKDLIRAIAANQIKHLTINY